MGRTSNALPRMARTPHDIRSVVAHPIKTSLKMGLREVLLKAAQHPFRAHSTFRNAAAVQRVTCSDVESVSTSALSNNVSLDDVIMLSGPDCAFVVVGDGHCHGPRECRAPSGIFRGNLVVESFEKGRRRIKGRREKKKE